MEINVATGEMEYGITGAKDYVSLEDRLWSQHRFCLSGARLFF
jgi:hypothetical protein